MDCIPVACRRQGAKSCHIRLRCEIPLAAVPEVGAVDLDQEALRGAKVHEVIFEISRSAVAGEQVENPEDLHFDPGRNAVRLLLLFHWLV